MTCPGSSTSTLELGAYFHKSVAMVPYVVWEDLVRWLERRLTKLRVRLPSQHDKPLFTLVFQQEMRSEHTLKLQTIIFLLDYQINQEFLYTLIKACVVLIISYKKLKA